MKSQIKPLKILKMIYYNGIKVEETRIQMDTKSPSQATTCEGDFYVSPIINYNLYFII